MRGLITTLGVALLGALSTNCSGVECGPGTFSKGNDCVGYDPNDKTPPLVTVTPAGGRSREPIPHLVMITTDEAARIVYTTDGTDPDPGAPGEASPVTLTNITQGMTLEYVAIDAAGNQTMPASTTFESDTVAPAPVGDLTLTLSGTTPHLTWTAPTDPDYAGVVLARVVDVVDVSPTPGQMVTSGADLSPSLKVVSTGTATSFDDTARPPGLVRYVAWSYDDLGNYSAPRAVQASIPLGSFAATLTFNTTNNTLTVATPPANLDLTGTTASQSGTTLTVSLSIKNNTTQYFQNPKIEILSTTNAGFSGSDGTADGHPFKTLGQYMLAPGATKTATLVYTGVAAGTTVTMNIAFATHPTMIVLRNTNQEQLIDYGSGTIYPGIKTTSRGPQDRLGGRVRPGVLTGGRYLDLPTSHGTIERYDLVTGTKATSITIGGGDRANIQWLLANRGELLAMVKNAGKRRVGTIEIVRLDEGLHELGRVKLPYSDDRGFTRPAISPDGNTLAMPVVGGILLLDIATLTPIDAVASTSALDLIVTGLNERVHALTFFDGTNGILAIGRGGGQASIIKRANGEYTKQLYQDANNSARGFSATIGPDGKVWFAFNIASGIHAYDPATAAISTVNYSGIPQGLSMVEGQMWIIRNDRVSIDQVDANGAIQRTLTLPAVSMGPAAGAYAHILDSLR